MRTDPGPVSCSGGFSHWRFGGVTAEVDKHEMTELTPACKKYMGGK